MKMAHCLYSPIIHNNIHSLVRVSKIIMIKNKYIIVFFSFQLRVFVSRPFVGIDAVQVISTPGHGTCDQCKPISYHLTRSPPFRTSGKVVTIDNVYTDRYITERTQRTNEKSLMVDSNRKISNPIRCNWQLKYLYWQATFPNLNLNWVYNASFSYTKEWRTKSINLYL